MPFVQGIHYSFQQSKETTPSRPPLIFIHGAGGSFLSFHPYLRHMQGETIYALDLPGHGKSVGKGRQSIEEYADEIARFMDDLQIASAVMVGLSMGSGIALSFALKYPHKVSALVVMGGGAKLRVAQSTLENVGKPETFEATVETINRACFSTYASNELVELSKKSMLSTGPDILFSDYLACNHFDVTTQLNQIRIPTLLLCGMEDAMTPPKYSQYLRDRLPNAQLHLLEKTGHMVTLEQPELVAKLLKQFLDELPPLS
ncbi:MAG TPA: alpha/beta hydrolase [Anaerolineales bacterium]|nr:alpha/beta hydrolase [Anaerolineales bacterium]